MEEIAAYETMHPQIRHELFGEWVAVYEGKLVDHDSDASALLMRVDEKYGDAPVLVREVTEVASPDIWMRTPSTGKLNP